MSIGAVPPPLEESPQKPNDDTGWRVTLYALLAFQFLITVRFLVETGFHVRVPVPISSPSLAMTAFIGTLLWCSESAIARPHLTRFAIRSLLAVILSWIVCLFVLPFASPKDSGERLADVTRAFHELVAEQKLPPPASQAEVSVSSRHGTAYSFRYKDTSGREQQIFASMQHERHWAFQTSVNGPRIVAPTQY